MNFLKRMVVKWMSDQYQAEANQVLYGSNSIKLSKAIKQHTNSPDCPSINFQIYPASGGNVVEVQYYNESLDKMYKALHIIPSDQDLGEGISKIITIEMLKK